MELIALNSGLPCPALEDALESWLDRRRGIERRSEKTIRANRHDVQRFIRFLNAKTQGREDARASLNELEHYIASLKTGGAAVNRAICSLRSFFEFLARHRLIEVNVAKELLKVPVLEPARWTPRAAEVQLLIAGAETARDKAMISLMAYAGLRRSEIRNLDFYDVEGLDMLGSCVIAVRKAKGNKTRMLPLNETATKALEEHLILANFKSDGPLFPHEDGSGQRLTADRITQLVKRLAKRLGLNRGITPHSLRRWFATTLDDKGGDILVISRLLGHRNIQTTADCYIKPNPGKLRKMVNELD
jgi:site-specific recombinase XerD